MAMGRIAKMEQYVEELDQRIIDLEEDIRRVKFSNVNVQLENVRLSTLKEISSDLKSILGIKEDE